MRNSNDAFLLAFPITFGITILVVAILVIVGVDIKIPLSIGLGSVTTLMTMSMLQRSTNKVLLMEDKTKAQKQTIVNYVFRYFFYALILVIAAIHPSFRVEFVAAGLIIFKLVLYILLFMNRKDGEQHD
jgi:hypothetical protein